jgi:hypothetical protein
MPKKLIETEGELQRWVEHTEDVVQELITKLIRFGALPPQDLRDVPTSDARWQLAQMMLDLIETVGTIAFSMGEMWGSTAGQICPYEDCAHDLALKNGGWWNCPHCLRDFWVIRVDLTEDFKTLLPGEDGVPRVKPDLIPMARDLGPSMLSPETWNDQD